MNINNQTEYWNRVANEKAFTHPIDTGLLSKYLRSDATIVDYGCGYGRLEAILEEDGFSNVTGFDTSEQLIIRGHDAGIANIFHLSGPENLRTEDDSADCILLFAVLTCIPSNDAQLKLVTLLASKLKPGGILYISDYYLQENSMEMDRYELLNNDENNYGIFHLPEGATFRHHTRSWIETLLGQFEVLEELTVDVMTMNGHRATAFQIIAKKQK